MRSARGARTSTCLWRAGESASRGSGQSGTVSALPVRRRGASRRAGGATIHPWWMRPRTRLSQFRRDRKGTTGRCRVPRSRRASTRSGFPGWKARPRSRARTARTRWPSAMATRDWLMTSSGSGRPVRTAPSTRTTPRLEFFSTRTSVSPYQDWIRGSDGARRWAWPNRSWAPSRSPSRKRRSPCSRAAAASGRQGAVPAGAARSRHAFISWMSRRPSRVRCSSTSAMAFESPATSGASPPVATTRAGNGSSACMRSQMPSTSPT